MKCGYSQQVRGNDLTLHNFQAGKLLESLL